MSAGPEHSYKDDPCFVTTTDERNPVKLRRSVDGYATRMAADSRRFLTGPDGGGSLNQSKTTVLSRPLEA